MNTRIATRIPLALLTLFAASCVSSSEVKNTGQVSTGQQLTDLTNAYRQGAITEKEYLRLKKAIIKNND